MGDTCNDDFEDEKIIFPKEMPKNKNLIEEIKPNGGQNKRTLAKKKDTFSDNLKKAYQQNKNQESDAISQNSEIKLRNNETFLTEIKSKRF